MQILTIIYTSKKNNKKTNLQKQLQNLTILQTIRRIYPLENSKGNLSICKQKAELTHLQTQGELTNLQTEINHFQITRKTYSLVKKNKGKISTNKKSEIY